jgi:protein-tyrosine phosphatase
MSNTSLFIIISLFIVVGFDVKEKSFKTGAVCNKMQPVIISIMPPAIALLYIKRNCLYLRMRILMVCLGNICRSPLAEGILQQKIKAAGLNWEVDSAGTNGFHVNEPPHYLSQRVAKKNGIDISKQVCRRFEVEDFERFDKVYAMAADVIAEMKRISGVQFDSKKVDLLLNLVYPNESRDVPDPWYGAESGYHDVFKLIDEACEILIKKS